MATSGIRFNDYFFSEPIHLASWTPPKCPGVFCIVMDDPNWAPKAFQPLYFGEFGNNSPASLILQDCRAVVAAAHGKTLYAVVLPMPFSTTNQRLILRNELISAYHPVYQTAVGKDQSGDLALELAELQKKHLEQADRMMQLMANINPATGTPVAPRRRIGFVTEQPPV